jgi:hypothetical protein
MEIKTTEQLLKMCKADKYIIADNIKWVRVDDIKEGLTMIIEYIKEYCIKFHKIDETEHCDCDKYILTILRHYNELSQSDIHGRLSQDMAHPKESDKLSNLSNPVKGGRVSD